MMKIKKPSSAKTLLLASASKLALAPGLASADSHMGGGGKGDEGPTPQLKLNQFVKPVDAFIPPINDQAIAVGGSEFEDEFALYDNAGIIFVGEIPEDGARMDFVVSNIRNEENKPVDVFVVCATQLAPYDEGEYFPGLDMDLDDYDDYEYDEDTRQGEKLGNVKPLEKRPKPGKKPNPGQGNKPPKVLAGEICVDLETKMEILAGVRVKPSMLTVPPAQETKIGKVLEPKYGSTIISIKLDKAKLQQLGLDEQELFFQAAAIPVGADPFAETQVSECDRYLIEPIIEGEGGEVIDPGMKFPDDIVTDGTTTPIPDPECTDGKGAC